MHLLAGFDESSEFAPTWDHPGVKTLQVYRVKASAPAYVKEV